MFAKFSLFLPTGRETNRFLRRKFFLNYQLNFNPSSIVRLPPLKTWLFKKVGESTKIYPAFNGLVFVN